MVFAIGQATMQTRAAMIQGAIAAAWLLAATANAQPIPTMSLVQPADLFQVSASPSGSLVAGLRSDHGQVWLWVFTCCCRSRTW